MGLMTLLELRKGGSMRRLKLSIMVISLVILLLGIAGCQPDAVYELVSLNDNITIRGNFFLGCGSLGGVPTFFFYARDAEGACHLETIRAHRAIIYEDEPTNPYVIFTNVGCDYPGRRIFHIPPNSIIRGFTLDAN